MLLPIRLLNKCALFAQGSVTFFRDQISNFVVSHRSARIRFPRDLSDVPFTEFHLVESVLYKVQVYLVLGFSTHTDKLITGKLTFYEFVHLLCCSMFHNQPRCHCFANAFRINL